MVTLDASNVIPTLIDASNVTLIIPALVTMTFKTCLDYILETINHKEKNTCRAIDCGV